MDSEFGYSLVPSSCLSHTSSSAESFIRMTIRFTWCATTWHLHGDPNAVSSSKGPTMMTRGRVHQLTGEDSEPASVAGNYFFL